LSGVVDRHEVSGYLGGLLRRATDLATRVGSAAADADPATLDARRDAALLASLRLDGSTLEALPEALAAASPAASTAATADEPDGAADDPAPLDAPPSSTATTPTPATRGRGTWFDAMRAFDDLPDAAVQACEAHGVRAAAAADDLVDRLVEDPAAALAELHRRLTAGLLAPDRAGQLRTSEQAVHDASIGRVIYFTADPDTLTTAVDDLAAWLRGPAGDLPPLLAAGVLHLELLRLHPYEAANGRLARAAARLWLRRNGLDPAGLAVPELALAEDPLGYHEEVASTVRRRDASIWLERWAEAVVDGLRGSARTLGVLPAADADLDPAEVHAAVDVLDPEFTIADARDRLHLADLAATGDRLEVLLDAGAIARIPGTRGLRFRRVG